MTRFEQELSGALGAFWKKNAEQEIERMQRMADNDEIRTNMNGAAFWNSNGRYIPADCAEILSHTDFPFSIEATTAAREAQVAQQLEAYRQNHRTSAEEREEMRAAFGTGTTVVNIITGERTRL